MVWIGGWRGSRGVGYVFSGRVVGGGRRRERYRRFRRLGGRGVLGEVRFLGR